MIYNFCLSIRAYFDLFRDIGGMYLDVYTQHISPGLEMVNNMQSEYNSASDPKSAQKVSSYRVTVSYYVHGANSIPRNWTRGTRKWETITLKRLTE
jgi:hypothetical protein